MHLIVTVACEHDNDCPYGGERERCDGECSVGEAACFGRAFVVVWDACSCDEESVCVDAVWGAGHERGLIGGVVALVYPSEIVGGDGADGLHLVGEGFTEGGDGEFIAFAGLVEFCVGVSCFVWLSVELSAGSSVWGSVRLARRAL